MGKRVADERRRLSRGSSTGIAPAAISPARTSMKEQGDKDSSFTRKIGPIGLVIIILLIGALLYAVYGLWVTAIAGANHAGSYTAPDPSTTPANPAIWSPPCGSTVTNRPTTT